MHPVESDLEGVGVMVRALGDVLLTRPRRPQAPCAALAASCSTLCIEDVSQAFSFGVVVLSFAVDTDRALRRMREHLLCAEDREREVVMRAHEQLVGALGLGCNHDLVGRERRQRIRDRQ
jgi:hypothetical protein